MKVSELSGKALDWAIIKAIYPGADGSALMMRSNRHTTDWAWAGPIIEREKIDIAYENNQWFAYMSEDDVYEPTIGTTALNAAMRCFVASKLGDEVDIPKELL